MEKLESLIQLVNKLIELPKEAEWVEFKLNNDNPAEIGEYISALSNSSAVHDKNNAYMIWGIDDSTHNIIGTSFDYRTVKKGNEDLEAWLRRMLSKNANFTFYSFMVNDKNVVLLVIYKVISLLVKFENISYIRVGSYKKI